MSEDTAQPPTRTRYGTAHPEWVENELWQDAIREEWTGYALRESLGIELARNTFRQDFSHSSYRDSEPGPYWSWQRFGRTSTPLPDGRVIHIGGEHEDFYDPDFCIYNDVVVEYPGGRREFYLYPKNVFPPTDSHTATLVGGHIILIGSLGYHDLRRPGETQVLKLDIRTLRIERVATSGEAPGWISRHIAEKYGERILAAGGKVATADSYEDNTGVFLLDLATMSWQRREHGDISVFPVPREVYAAEKNPRYGTANPERADNPFWLEMARRRWLPSRARMHFGDFAPPQPETVLPKLGNVPEYGTPEADEWAARISEAADASRLKRTREDIVWTAVREDALELMPPDGRKLTIGGEINDYGDEYADPWVYNDIVVTHPDGAVEIFAYPLEVFPHLYWPADVVVDGDAVIVFGLLSHRLHPDKARSAVALRLDTVTFAMTHIPVPDPAVRLNMQPGFAERQGNRVLLWLVRWRDADPELLIAFDLTTNTWSEPFPNPNPDTDGEGNGG